MKLVFKRPNTSVKNFMRVCGYLEIVNPHTKKISYARRLDPGRFYPRFHIYIEESPNQITANLHLDAKQPSYEGAKAHSGEYEGPLVEKELQRIKAISEKFISRPPAEKPLGFNPPAGGKRSLWRRFFGKK